MSRILIIGSDCTQLSDEISAALTTVDLPLECAAGHADALARLQMRSFGVVITSCNSSVDEDLALLTEMRADPAGAQVHCIWPVTALRTR